MCVSIELLGIVDGSHFWQILGNALDTQSTCSDSASIIIVVEASAARTKKRVCLIVDGLDSLPCPRTRALVGVFLSVLRELKMTSYFYGFLGVGRSALACHHELASDNPRASIYAETKLLQAESFSTKQMAAFFELIEPCFNFAKSLRQAIMECSGGAPGVFGSLVRYTATHTKWTKEWREWESWFKLVAFSEYLLHNNAYFCMNKELCRLTALERRALKYALQAENVTARELQTLCGESIKSEEKTADKLQDMGILVQAMDGKLSVVSEMVHRVCVEALPERDAQAIENAGDPLVLLSAAVRGMRPEVIPDFGFGNDKCPPVAAFHQELFCTMRDILKETQRFTRDRLKAQSPNSARRTVIIVADNSVRFGFEVKVRLMDEAAIIEAERQADEYRVFYSVKRMVLVNFIPLGDKAPELIAVKEFPEFQDRSSSLRGNLQYVLSSAAGVNVGGQD